MLTNCPHVREPLGQVRPRRHSPFMFARVSSLSTARAVAQRPTALRMQRRYAGGPPSYNEPSGTSPHGTHAILTPRLPLW